MEETSQRMLQKKPSSAAQTAIVDLCTGLTELHEVLLILGKAVESGQRPVIVADVVLIDFEVRLALVLFPRNNLGLTPGADGSWLGRRGRSHGWWG